MPDVDPDAFLALLNYLYTDEIQLEPDNVLATLYAAKKYIVPHLARYVVIVKFKDECWRKFMILEQLAMNY